MGIRGLFDLLKTIKLVLDIFKESLFVHSQAYIKYNSLLTMFSAAVSDSSNIKS